MAHEWTWERSAPSPFVPPRGWGGGREPLCACVEIDRARLVEALGPPHFPDGEIDGIGPLEEWAFLWPCGCEVVVWAVHPLGEPPPRADVLSTDADVDHVLHHIALPGPVSWRADADPKWQRTVHPERWSLRRQDDNGNDVPMRTFESRSAAECARATYEARGHKQLYSIERA